MTPLTWFALAVAAAAAVAFLIVRRRLRQAETEVDRLSRTVALEAAAAKAAELEREQLLRAINGIPVGTLTLGPDGDVVFSNAIAERFVNARHGDAVVEAAIRRLGGQSAAAGDVVEEEIEVHASGNEHLSIQAVPVTGVPGVAALVFVEDITNRRAVETMRRDFVANVSHELRTPLGALSLLAETLADEVDADVRKRLTTRMSDEAFRMSRLIEDVLTLSHIEGEGSELEPLDLRAVVLAAAERMKTMAAQQGVELVTEAGDEPLRIAGDRGQLESVVGNLTENAIKYTAAAERPHGGRVTVGLGSADDAVLLTVVDQGVGIAEEHLDRIFERFYRIDRGRSRQTGGTGLGLAIVRHVVRNHAGAVNVESTPGVGSSFEVRLPIAPSQDVAEQSNVRTGRP